MLFFPHSFNITAGRPAYHISPISSNIANFIPCFCANNGRYCVSGSLAYGDMVCFNYVRLIRHSVLA